MPNQMLEIIKRRRTTRSFKEDQIKEEELVVILEAGLWAPSGHNMQPWKFIVIQNKEIIGELNRETKELMKDSSIETFKKMANNENFDIFYSAPTVILALYDEKAMTPIQDISAATQNMLLMAESMEVGACWNGIIKLGFSNEEFSKKYKEKLNIAEGYVVNHAIVLGYAKAKALRGPERKVDNVTYIR